MRAVWMVAVVMVAIVACGKHGGKTAIQRTSKPTIQRDVELLTDEWISKTRPSLTIKGVSGPLADGVKKRMEASAFPSKGGIVVDISEETDIKGSSGEYKATVMVNAAFAQSPHAITFDGLLSVHLTYSNATPEQLGASIGDAVVEWLESEKLPADIGPRTGTVPKVTRIAAGSISCTLHDDGSVRCWNSVVDTALPVPAAGDSIAVAGSEIVGACGVRKNGRVWCIDAWDDSKQTFDVRDVCGVSGARDVDVSVTTACAVLANGHVQCWPRDPKSFEPCGADAKPVEVANLTDAVSMTHGLERDCALVKDGTVKCWSVIAFSGNDPKDDYKASAATALGKPGMFAFYDLMCTTVAPNKASCAKTTSRQALELATPDPIKQLVWARDELCALTDHGDVFCSFLKTSTKVDGLSDVALLAGNMGQLCGVTNKNVIVCREQSSDAHPHTIEQMP